MLKTIFRQHVSRALPCNPSCQMPQRQLSALCETIEASKCKRWKPEVLKIVLTRDTYKYIGNSWMRMLQVAAPAFGESVVRISNTCDVGRSELCAPNAKAIAKKVSRSMDGPDDRRGAARIDFGLKLEIVSKQRRFQLHFLLVSSFYGKTLRLYKNVVNLDQLLTLLLISIDQRPAVRSAKIVRLCLDRAGSAQGFERLPRRLLRQRKPPRLLWRQHSRPTARSGQRARHSFVPFHRHCYLHTPTPALPVRRHCQPRLLSV